MNYLFFLLIVILMSLMDVLDFRFKRGSGFWSIDNSLFIDAWHSLKLLLYGIIIFKLFDVNQLQDYGSASIELVIYIAIAVFPHWLILHYFFKES